MMLADKPTSFKPLFRHSMEANVIKKGVLEVYGLKCIGHNSNNESKKLDELNRIELRKKSGRSGSVAVNNFFSNNETVSAVDENQNIKDTKQQQKYLDKFNEIPGQKVFVTVYKTCTEYFAVIYPLKIILSARLPINCINLKTSKLEKLENNLIKLFFGLKDGEFAYSIVLKDAENSKKKETKKNKEKYPSDDELDKNKKNFSSDDEELSEDNNVVSFAVNDEEKSDSINFVTWEDALSGNIEITPDGELINNRNSKTNQLNPNLNFLTKSTNSNLLTVKTDEHRRRLSLQTVPETDEDDRYT